MASDDRWFPVLQVISVLDSEGKDISKGRLYGLVYLAEKLGGLETNYSYCFEYYTIRSRDLSADIGFMEAIGCIDYYDGRKIQLTQDGKDFVSNRHLTLSEQTQDFILHYGSYDAHYIGLLAQIHFLLGTRSPNNVADGLKGLLSLHTRE